MSMSDPIADLLTRIRNAQRAHKAEVSMPASNAKCAICEVLKDEGYINDYNVVDSPGNKRILTIALKYFEGQPVIELLQRVSRPGLRIFRDRNKLPTVKGGLGVAIISTSRGVVSDRKARALGHGGEVICYVA